MKALLLRFGRDFCLCCLVLSRLLDLHAGVEIKPVVRACLGLHGALHPCFPSKPGCVGPGSGLDIKLKSSQEA